nr:MAG TPA: hypothetical protein [Caudoviricetes sp.]
MKLTHASLFSGIGERSCLTVADLIYHMSCVKSL